MSRIAARFAELKAQGRAAFVPFITAGDPDFETSRAILEALPGAGADVIELGMPFSDPMADGPAVQASSLRALKAGATMARTMDLVRSFRQRDDKTPIVLMGYYNPIHARGGDVFVREAAAAGVDGLLIVDLPPEEDAVLLKPAMVAGLDIIRLVTPTTHDARLVKVLSGGRRGESGPGAHPQGEQPSDRCRLRDSHAGTGRADRAYRRCGGGGLRYCQHRCAKAGRRQGRDRDRSVGTMPRAGRFHSRRIQC